MTQESIAEQSINEQESTEAKLPPSNNDLPNKGEDSVETAQETQAKILEEVLGKSAQDAGENQLNENAVDNPKVGSDQKLQDKDPEELDENQIAQENKKPDEGDVKNDVPTDEEIAQSLKSERGRVRFQEVLKEKSTLEQENKNYVEIINSIRDTLASAKLTPEDFAANIEFNRLRNSDNVNDIRIAYEMIEQERANLAIRLGIKAPGINYLAEHPDLAKAYSEGKIDDDAALELVRNRRYVQELEQNRIAHEQNVARQQQSQQAINASINQINAFLSSKKGEIDYLTKEKYITDYLNDAIKREELINTYEPHQWPSVIKMIYDSMPAQKTSPTKRQAQPISTRTSYLGKPTIHGKNEEERMHSILENMGL